MTRLDRIAYNLRSKADELLASKFMESQGYTVISLAAARGPDIVCSKDGREFTVEVKRASATGGQWLTTHVYPARRNDDLVAIVMPNESVHLCSMVEHLAKAQASTVRSVRDLVRDYCPDLAPICVRPDFGRGFSMRLRVAAGVAS